MLNSGKVYLCNGVLATFNMYANNLPMLRINESQEENLAYMRISSNCKWEQQNRLYSGLVLDILAKSKKNKIAPNNQTAGPLLVGGGQILLFCILLMHKVSVY